VRALGLNGAATMIADSAIHTVTVGVTAWRNRDFAEIAILTAS
jgi:hypothetical protein